MRGLGAPVLVSKRRMGILYVTRFKSSIGELTLASSEKGLAYVGLPRASGRGLMGWSRRHAPDEVFEEAPEAHREVIEQLTQFVAGEREVFELSLDLRATPFQLDVYGIVSQIPYGESVSYSEVARCAGRAAAVRAVGAANAANPIPLVIPCHRVVASDGQLQGYAGGLELKAQLLAMESSSHPAQGALF